MDEPPAKPEAAGVLIAVLLETGETCRTRTGSSAKFAECIVGCLLALALSVTTVLNSYLYVQRISRWACFGPHVWHERCLEGCRSRGATCEVLISHAVRNVHLG